MSRGLLTMRKLVSYYRVSTKRQGESGLGLDGQVAAFEQYLKAYGGVEVRSFREVESGKRVDRVELLKAIALAKRLKATLVVAKLDRLARNVAFTSAIMESGVDFVCCDNPTATRLTIHILAAVAEDEARRISERTKSALAAYVSLNRVSKRIRDLYPQGVPAELVELTAGKLGASRPGAPQLTREQSLKGSAAAAEKRRELAKDVYTPAAPVAAGLRAEGLSLRQIAARLNDDGHTTVQGKSWSPMQVSRVLSMAI